MGAVQQDGEFGVSRKKIEGTEEQQMDGIGLTKCRRLDEPEFYCTDVTYSMLPATRQVDSIQMRGNLEVGNTSKAQAMMEEISGWMAKDYGAVDLGVATPAGTLALKKFKIGNGMDVEVTVKWKSPHTVKGCDADIAINFTTSELVEENRYQRQELGKTMDEVRTSTQKETGVNYFNVNPTVNADAVAKKVVY